MFRFNNPDALLVFLMTAARLRDPAGHGAGRGRWLVLAGVLVGFGFLTKMLQAFLVLPAFVAGISDRGADRLRTRMCTCSPPWPRWSCRSAGGWPWSSCCRPRCGPYRRFAEQLGAGTDLRLQRARPDHRERDRQRRRPPRWRLGARPGSPGCSTGLRRHDQLADPGRADARPWRRMVTIGRRSRARTGSGGDHALGRLAAGHRAGVLVHGRDLSTTTTRWRWPRPSPALVSAAELWQQRERWLARIGLAAAVDATTAWAFVLLARASEPYPSLSGADRGDRRAGHDRTAGRRPAAPARGRARRPGRAACRSRPARRRGSRRPRR